MEKRWKLSANYISPALAGGIIGMLVNGFIYYFYSYSFIPSQLVVRFFVTAFLFSIGLKMGLTYQRKQWIHLFYLFSITTFLLFTIELMAWIFFKNNLLLLQVFNSQTFSWNDEWTSRLKMWFSEHLGFQFHFSLILVFLLTPVVIRWMSKLHIDKEMSLHKISSVRSWPFSAVLTLFFVTMLALLLKHFFFYNAIFLFDLVISMCVGFIIGNVLKSRKSKEVDQWIVSVLSIGTLSLYGFIISMLFKSSMYIWMDWSWTIAGLFTIKFIVITFIWIWVSRKWVNNHPKLVLISACWAFTLSAPVTCMNAMHSVVRRHGAADQVLLLIPPVILWLINYPHYWLYLWLYK
ncbi:sodium/glutamate symporter [Chengkuizengella axinellae]|uniref:Sodium/glutamate symporter n=1 Tax=Chengkuizengella axinellae TaxID=3064388 RepID=A0ABT9IXX2_9BACL|nr:sodium/glutamate symporter [Chengkuizengella sp. 2205SS18-9]MDP5273645.1 sodium/glutamate symporter [Chengkuizengella sp. 2205SS18-9]